MKTMFLVFFSIIFAIYFFVNFYIFRHGTMAFPKEAPFRSLLVWLFWLVVLAFPLGRFLERVWISPISDAVVWIGAFWLPIMLYLLIACLSIDLLRLSNLVYPWMSRLFPLVSQHFRMVVLLSVVGGVLLVVFAGHINAISTRVSKYSFKVEKDSVPIRNLRIVAVSDIHLGTIIGKHRLDRLVELVNSQNPDIVLLAGDVVDEDIAPVIRRNLGAKLEQLSSKYGTYAVLGNHEYIGGATKAYDYLSKHKVHMLRDSVALVDSAFYIVGRDDRDSRRMKGSSRKSLEMLLSGIDRSKPIIVLDHQPFNLEEPARQKVDLQISGHTHHGQIWPFNYVTSAIFELSSGYTQKDATNIIVSNGYGTWGPPVRLGNRPEILVIDLSFGK